MSHIWTNFMFAEFWINDRLDTTDNETASQLWCTSISAARANPTSRCEMNVIPITDDSLRVVVTFLIEMLFILRCHWLFDDAMKTHLDARWWARWLAILFSALSNLAYITKSAKLKLVVKIWRCLPDYYYLTNSTKLLLIRIYRFSGTIRNFTL